MSWLFCLHSVNGTEVLNIAFISFLSATLAAPSAPAPAMVPLTSMYASL